MNAQDESKELKVTSSSVMGVLRAGMSESQIYERISTYLMVLRWIDSTS